MYQRKSLGAEYRTNKLNPHMAPSLEIEPGQHWRAIPEPQFNGLKKKTIWFERNKPV